MWSLASGCPCDFCFQQTFQVQTKGEWPQLSCIWKTKICQDQTLQIWDAVFLFSCLYENQIIPCCYFVKLVIWLPQITHKNKPCKYTFIWPLLHVTRKHSTASSKDRQMSVDRTYRALTELLILLYTSEYCFSGSKAKISSYSLSLLFHT